MQKADKTDEQSLEDILASVRKLMAEAPPAEPAQAEQPAQTTAPPGNDLSDILDEPTIPAARAPMPSEGSGQGLGGWPFATSAGTGATGEQSRDETQPQQGAVQQEIFARDVPADEPPAAPTGQDGQAAAVALPVEPVAVPPDALAEKVETASGSGAFPNPQPVQQEDQAHASPLVARLRELSPGAAAKPTSDEGAAEKNDDPVSPDAVSSDAAPAETTSDDSVKSTDFASLLPDAGAPQADTSSTAAAEAVATGLGSPAASGNEPVAVTIEPEEPAQESAVAEAKETVPEPFKPQQAEEQKPDPAPEIEQAGGSALPTAVAESLAAIAAPAMTAAVQSSDEAAKRDSTEADADSSSSAASDVVAADAAAPTGAGDTAADESDASLEARFTELLRPIVNQWLDDNLAGLVEKAVEKQLRERS